VKSEAKFFLVMLLSLLISSPWWGTAAAAAAPEESASGEVCVEGRGEGFQPKPFAAECVATFGPIITDTAIPTAKGDFVIQPTWLVPITYGRFDGNWRRGDAGGDFVGFEQLVKLTYGLWDNLEVFVELATYKHNWASNVSEPGPQGERNANFGGVGDLALVFKYGLFEETARRPQITAFWGTVFPTGHYRRLNPGRLGTDELGGGSYDFVLGFNLQKWVKPFIFYGNLWYTLRTDYTADGEDALGIPRQVRVHPRDVIILNFAMEYPLTQRWVFLLEFLQFYEGGRLIGPPADQDPAAKISILPGIEFMATDKLSMALGLNIDLAGKNEDANLTPVFSLVYLF